MQQKKAPFPGDAKKPSTRRKKWQKPILVNLSLRRTQGGRPRFIEQGQGHSPPISR
jgi:hypothetical protein